MCRRCRGTAGSIDQRCWTLAHRTKSIFTRHKVQKRQDLGCRPFTNKKMRSGTSTKGRRRRRKKRPAAHRVPRPNSYDGARAPWEVTRLEKKRKKTPPLEKKKKTCWFTQRGWLTISGSLSSALSPGVDERRPNYTKPIFTWHARCKDIHHHTRSVPGVCVCPPD